MTVCKGLNRIDIELVKYKFLNLKQKFIYNTMITKLAFCVKIKIAFFTMQF